MFRTQLCLFLHDTNHVQLVIEGKLIGGHRYGRGRASMRLQECHLTLDYIPSQYSSLCMWVLWHGSRWLPSSADSRPLAEEVIQRVARVEESSTGESVPHME